MFKILSVLLIIAVQLSAQYEAVNSKIDSLLQEKFFESTVASVSAYNLTKDEPVYKKNEKLLLRPASNMKVISSSTMLYFLGPDYKYYTGIYSDGIIRNGTLYGDIYFYGNGDPSFSSSDLDSLIVMLKEKNVTEITGNVYGDVSAYDSIFWGEGWMWDDDPSYYFPYFSPLILNESGVTVTLIKNENEELEVKTFPESNYFKVVNLVNIKEEGRSRINITRDWLNRNNDITVKGSVNKKFTKYSTTISLFNPSDFFMFYTIERLKANGIRINGNYSFKERPEEITEIGKIESNFGDLINVLNKESDNFYAEIYATSTSEGKNQYNDAFFSGGFYNKKLPMWAMIDGESAEIINESNSGLVSPAGDYKKLAENIILASSLSKKALDRYGNKVPANWIEVEKKAAKK